MVAQSCSKIMVPKLQYLGPDLINLRLTVRTIIFYFATITDQISTQIHTLHLHLFYRYLKNERERSAVKTQKRVLNLNQEAFY